MKKKFAIAGCGNICERHAENIAKEGILKSVCDIEFPKAKSFAAKYGAVPYHSLEDMLEVESELDVVTICTPNGLHATQAVYCLNRDLNVLCEKPLCLSVEDGYAMIAAEKKSKGKLFIVKQNRFNQSVLKLKSLLDKNILGKIYSFQVNGFWNRPVEYYANSWKGSRALDGGILFTQFSHFIDLLYWLLGDVSEVMAIAANYHHPKIEIEDTVAATVILTGGAIGTLHFTNNAYRKNMEGSFTIFGEKGTVKIGGEYLNTIEYVNVKAQINIKNEHTSPANDYGYYKGSMSNHDKVYQELFKALDGKPHNLPGINDAVKTVGIIQKIYAAAALPAIIPS